MTDEETEAAAIKRLGSDFPDVPARIIAAVLTGYIPATASLIDAVELTRARIADACAA